MSDPRTWAEAMDDIAYVARRAYGPGDPKVVPWDCVILFEHWCEPNLWSMTDIPHIARENLELAREIITGKEDWLRDSLFFVLHTESFYRRASRRKVYDALEEISPAIDWAGADEFLAAMDVLEHPDDTSIPGGIVIPGLDDDDDDYDDDDEREAKRRKIIIEWARDVVDDHRGADELYHKPVPLYDIYSDEPCALMRRMPAKRRWW